MTNSLSGSTTLPIPSEESSAYPSSPGYHSRSHHGRNAKKQPFHSFPAFRYHGYFVPKGHPLSSGARYVLLRGLLTTLRNIDAEMSVLGARCPYFRKNPPTPFSLFRGSSSEFQPFPTFLKKRKKPEKREKNGKKTKTEAKKRKKGEHPQKRGHKPNFF